MNAINRFRAELCYRMKVEHQKKFKTFEKCKKFMKEACRPGNDKVMDGDRGEISSGKGSCKEYFHDAEEKAREQIEKEDREEEEQKKESPTPPPPAPRRRRTSPPAPRRRRTSPPVPKEEKEEGKESAAPAPPELLPVSDGDYGKSGKNFIPGKNKGKPAKIADDEAYYFKKNGQDWRKRLHMDEDLKLPTQGYWGKLVEHEDMQTWTEDR